MNGQTLSALVLAAVAIAGAIGSVLMLAIRVGTLIGKLGAHMETMTTTMTRLWQEVGAINARQDRHVEVFHGSHGRDR